MSAVAMRNSTCSSKSKSFCCIFLATEVCHGLSWDVKDAFADPGLENGYERSELPGMVI